MYATRNTGNCKSSVKEPCFSDKPCFFVLTLLKIMCPHLSTRKLCWREGDEKVVFGRG